MDILDRLETLFLNFQTLTNDLHELNRTLRHHGREFSVQLSFDSF